MRFDVSVVIPVKDGMPDVVDAVRSAIGQSHPPREIVLVDDGSADGGADQVERAFGERAGPRGEIRLRVLRGRFGSAGAARNAGWRAATGEWIAFLDADDLWFEGKLAAAAEILEAAPGAQWFFSDGAFRTLEGEMKMSWLESYADLPEGWIGSPVGELIDVNFVLTSSVVVRRDALDQVGGFDPSLSHAEDADLWIRLARRFTATASRRALVRYQHRPGGLTRQLEARLGGDVRIFERLAGDVSLDPALRAAARRRAALAHFKLGMSAAREGRMIEARRAFAAAWRSPERRPGVAVTWASTWLPAPLFVWLRGRGWAKRAAAPMKRVRRVMLKPAPPHVTAGPGAPSEARVIPARHP